MSSMDDIDSYELARSTGINPRYCETFRSVIRLFFWNGNQVLRYPERYAKPPPLKLLTCNDACVTSSFA